MITVKQQIPPPGGWHYEEDGVRTEATTYANLIQAVLSWKLQARRPVHNVQNEVNAYIARISPQSVLVRKLLVKHMERQIRSLADRIYNFSCRVYDNFSPDKVSATPAEADRRGRICSNCPYNKSYNFGCSACQSETERLLQAVRANRRTQYDDQLQGCEGLGYHLPTAVWLENDQLGPPSPDPRLPKNCWRRAS